MRRKLNSSSVEKQERKQVVRVREKIRIVRSPIRRFNITPDPHIPKQFDVWMGAVKFKFQIEDLIELTEVLAETLNRSKKFWR